MLHDVTRGVCYVKRQAPFWLLGFVHKFRVIFVYYFVASWGT
jgi:hypothetical protein